MVSRPRTLFDRKPSPTERSLTTRHTSYSRGKRRDDAFAAISNPYLYLRRSPNLGSFVTFLASNPAKGASGGFVFQNEPTDLFRNIPTQAPMGKIVRLQIASKNGGFVSQKHMFCVSSSLGRGLRGISAIAKRGDCRASLSHCVVGSTRSRARRGLGEDGRPKSDGGSVSTTIHPVS
jgi:hypothetical protein